MKQNHKKQKNAETTDKTGQTLYYQCGNSAGVWRDDVFSQKVPDFPKDKPVTFAVYGDYGTQEINPAINGSIYKALMQAVLDDESLDFIFHGGDIAYDLHTSFYTYLFYLCVCVFFVGFFHVCALSQN